MSIRLVFAVFASSVLHFVVIWLAPKSTRVEAVQPAKVVQSVQLVYGKGRALPDMRSSANPARVDMRPSANSAGAEKPSIQRESLPRPNITAAQQQFVEPPSGQLASSVNGGPSESPETTPSEVQAVAEQPAAEKSVVEAAQGAVPCQSIVLPEQWTRLTHVWPRRYQVEFSVQDVNGREQILVENMNAVGDPLAALDRRVRQAFADCILDRQSDLKLALSRAFGLLKPASGQAYLQTIEFYPSSMNVASQQGT